MSNDSIKKSNDHYELKEEYDLSKLPIVPKGRYAPERRAGSNLVVLDPDLARAFPSDEAVNKALRFVLQILETQEKMIILRETPTAIDAAESVLVAKK